MGKQSACCWKCHPSHRAWWGISRGPPLLAWSRGTSPSRWNSCRTYAIDRRFESILELFGATILELFGAQVRLRNWFRGKVREVDRMQFCEMSEYTGA